MDMYPTIRIAPMSKQIVTSDLSAHIGRRLWIHRWVFTVGTRQEGGETHMAKTCETFNQVRQDTSRGQ
ncbi:hypothetical protein ACN38_g3207 [Penicillium nordicum]|uniref:Uncharacterized protein n=1 Tax=Penicillium nordicum TaxID=229535 RepID=A0A0N0RZG6_9EURO|nr:hypothetical protein ACN38_g3207 [Penicillium nordicum]